jgi:hypothetical protein
MMDIRVLVILLFVGMYMVMGLGIIALYAIARAYEKILCKIDLLKKKCLTFQQKYDNI